ncbi:hypothetical protein GP486_002069 [Trichoglossum hirsutum]|uniref:Uncharacterized protein n=1 Tax=Trichoglossum hirsutum TaxID=265104 RepID=A0A9P8RS38_9PEZI|nr:hypothetical protein GP486_002069 [Trichoglossum hirsutum]
MPALSILVGSTTPAPARPARLTDITRMPTPSAELKRTKLLIVQLETATNCARAVQYVRCTLQKSPDDVASCVADNAVKADWLPQIQSYTGAKSCPDIDVYLVSQGLHILRHVLGSLISVLFWPWVVYTIARRFKSFQRQRDGKKESAELRDFHQISKGSESHLDNGWVGCNPWVLEKRYTLKATRLLQTIGREVLVAYLTTIVLSKSGTFGTSSFNEEISFYVVRPRPAPFLGLLGLFEPWSQKGLAELVVDGMLSFVAGTNVAINYWGLVNHPPDNPAAPASDLKNLAVGAVMTCIPAFAVLAITFLVSMAMVSDSDKKKPRRKEDDGCATLIAGLCIWSLWLLAIAAFICVLPLVALVEMVAAAVVAIRKKGKNGGSGLGDDDDSWPNAVRRSRWEEPLTTTSGKFRVLYALFVLSSFVINVGNWLFFANYLKLEGEMYCPTEVGRIMAIWVLVPFGIDLLFYAFRAWTRDTYADTHPQHGSAHEVPPL